MKLVILTLAAVLASTPPAHPVDPAGNRVLGEWRGTSLCTNRKLAPACKDEIVRYVFTGPADSTGTYHLVAEKLVGEAFQFMGDADLGYTAADSTWSFGFTSPGCKGCRWWFRIGPAGLVGGLLSGEGDTLRAVAAHRPGPAAGKPPAGD